MSMIQSDLLLGQEGGAGGYQVQRSVRFNSADSAYLSRTPGSAGNRKTWTWAGWVKISALAATSKVLFGTADAVTNNNSCAIRFNPNLQLEVYDLPATFNMELVTTQVFRDTGAWSHIVVAVDTTQSTSANRVKIYFNGSQITAFGTATYPSQNLDTIVNSTVLHGIGRGGSYDALYFNGYLADIHFIDGQALDPTSFGEFDTNGVWQPKAYSGTYGTNGFHLDFSNNSTAAALGTDTSGNGNTWTVNNISVTAGAGNDSLVDSPTNYGSDTGAGGQVRGNYCTLTPLISTSSTLSNGNLDYASTATYQSAFSTFGVRTGKWYFEAAVGTFATDAVIGVASAPFSTATYVGGTATSWGYEGAVGRIYNNAAFSAYGATFGAGDVIGVAFDADTGKLWFAKNGTWQASGNPATGANPAATLTTGIDYLFGVSAGSGGTWTCNFGARAFTYTAPSGFKALCTQNLPTPTITKGNTAMDVVLYTGTGAALTPTSALGFSPDFVWIKGRSGATDHALYDTVRGATIDLVSNSTAAETTQTQGLTAFNSNGFSVGTLAKINTNAATYAAWAWDGGSSTVTNTAGTISSQVRANASAGFSVVTYTGTGTLSTVGHGLGVKPALLIIKNRDAAIGWIVYHSSMGATKYLLLNTTDSEAASANAWNNTEPTSSVFTLAAGNGLVNVNNNKAVAYCFAPVAGYSAFGSYVGNGSTDGPMVFCNFRPAFVLIKSSSAAGNWMMYDYARGSFNLNSKKLAAASALAENDATNLGGDTVGIDFLSNGFKIRTTGANHNDSSVTYVYACFAENPFSLARAR